MKEIWRNISGYENLYQISNLGRVKSIKRNKIRKTGMSGKYKSVILHKNNKPKAFTIHRLVAIAFIENPENKEQVNHIDENKLNNNVDNLEWCTRSENALHTYKNSPRKISTFRNIKKAKLTEEMVLTAFTLKDSYRIFEIAKMLKVERRIICNLFKGKRYSSITHNLR